MDIGQLLDALMSQDNIHRAQAEAFYKTQCDTNASSMALQLTECLALHQVLS